MYMQLAVAITKSMNIKMKTLIDTNTLMMSLTIEENYGSSLKK
jgi:hypothetical protein